MPGRVTKFPADPLFLAQVYLDRSRALLPERFRVPPDDPIARFKAHDATLDALLRQQERVRREPHREPPAPLPEAPRSPLEPLPANVIPLFDPITMRLAECDRILDELRADIRRDERRKARRRPEPQ